MGNGVHVILLPVSVIALKWWRVCERASPKKLSGKLGTGRDHEQDNFPVSAIVFNMAAARN